MHRTEGRHVRSAADTIHHWCVRALAATAVLALTAHAAIARASAPLEPGERIATLQAGGAGNQGQPWQAFRERAATVIVFRDRRCAAFERAVPALAQLSQRFTRQGVAFVIIDISRDMRTSTPQADPGSGIQVVPDPRRMLVEALGPAAIGEAFLVDRAGTLQYRGAVQSPPAPAERAWADSATPLMSAIASVLAGEEPVERSTEVSECRFGGKAAVTARSKEIDYHGRISRIIQTKCQLCHRQGGLGPMPLEQYAQVYARRQVIDFMVRGGRMPPWAADPRHGEWANDRSLSVLQKRDLLGWIAAGAPEGSPANAPLGRRFVDGWSIGQPDTILRTPEEMRVPAEGVVDYVNQYLQTSFDRDRWISGVEIRSSQPKVVHHVLAFIEDPAHPRNFEEGDPDGILAAGGPGAMGAVYPPGTGKRLPKGARILLVIHYQPNGTAVDNHVEVGLRFTDQPAREVLNLAAFSVDFSIPPHRAHQVVRAMRKLERAGTIISLLPHMHVRGQSFRYDIRFPDGRVQRLLDVPRYDFNWQSTYVLRKPIHAPAGSEVVATAVYNNSKSNPWNPDPTKTVVSGAQTTDEMMIGYFEFIEDAVARPAGPTMPPGGN